MSTWHTKVKDAFVGVATKEMNKDDFIKEYRSLVDELVYCRNRLKNPVNKKSGKPLAKSTIGGFKDKIDYLKKQLKRYRVVLKLLVMCEYMDKKPDELSIEQEVIKAFLRDYISQEWQIKFWQDRANLYEKKAEHWKISSDAWEILYDGNDNLKKTDALISELKKSLDSDTDDDEETGEDNSPCKVYPFPVIDGGKKLEEPAPFASLT